MDIQLLLQDYDLDILGITETHVTGETQDKDLVIEGYTLIRKERTGKETVHGRKGYGGCLVYVKQTIKVVPMIDKFEDDMEAIWLEICIHSQKMMIGTLYRHPKDLEFYKKLDKVLEIIRTRRKILP